MTPHGGPAIASNHYYTSMQHDQVIEQLSASNTDIIQVTDHSNIMWKGGGGVGQAPLVQFQNESLICYRNLGHLL